MADLEQIWADAFPDPIGPWDDLWRLSRLGVPTRCLGDIGALNVKVGKPWAPLATGERAVILQVRDPEDGELIDLVAFRLETPKSFWTMTGVAPVLGYHSLLKAEHETQILREDGCPEEWMAARWSKGVLFVHESPLEWLRAGRRGVVFLDWQRYWPLWLSGVAALRCVDEAFGRRLRSMIRRPFPCPEIQVAT